MSHTQRGLPTALPASDALMQERGWNRKADTRVGKTKRDIESGARRNAALNREARRDVPGKYVAGEKVDEKYVHTNKRSSR